jgi:glycosyltransferase involved in cell wall biosynthesis
VVSADTSVIPLPDDDTLIRGAVAAMADPGLRAVMAQLDVPLAAVRRIPPWLGSSWIDDQRNALEHHEQFDSIVAFRASMVGFAAGVAARHQQARLVLDLDDDEATVFRSLGDRQSADAVTDLTEWALSVGARVVTAGRHDDGRVGRLPNCVTVADVPCRQDETDAHPPGVLFVGNCTYRPNIAGIRWFVDFVWPLVRLACTDAQCVVVGNGSRSLGVDDAATGVRTLGLVDHLEAVYETADVVVAPILDGSGTRIKVLEAWAHQRAVVTTSVGCDGLVMTPGTHALVADNVKQFAESIVFLLLHAAERERLGRAGRELVAQRYSSDVFDGLVERLLMG